MYGFGYTGIISSMKKVGGSAVDADAQTYITNVGLTGANATAWNQLVLDLKAYSLWSKMIQILPGCWNDATKNAVDGKNTLNATMNGGLTHSGNLINGNGTNGYISTLYNTNALPLNNIGHSYYCSANFYEDNYFAGTYVAPNYHLSTPRNSYNTYRLAINDQVNGQYFAANSNSLGFFSFNRVDSSNVAAYRNGTLLHAFAQDSEIAPNAIFRFFVVFGGGSYSARSANFFLLHNGLNSTEAGNLHTAISAFKTTIGI